LKITYGHPGFRNSTAVGIVLAIIFALFLVSRPASAAEADPFESVNRVTHKFNRIVDGLLLKPIATTYDAVTPRFVRTGVKNIFSNLDDIQVTVNDLAQFKFKQAASDFGRFAVNSTVGVGGLFNVAGPVLGLEKHREDFGQTLAHWNIGAGPYIVLPFLGPSTVRDSFGLIVDSLVDPVPNISHVETRNAVVASEIVDFRASVLSFDDFVIGDDYLFIRGFYMQRREYLENDGVQQLAFEEF